MKTCPEHHISYDKYEDMCPLCRSNSAPPVMGPWTCFLLALILGLLFAGLSYGQGLKVKKPTHAETMQAKAWRWAPMVELQVLNYWPDMPEPRNVLLSQVEKESLWNPKAQLKTSRELGRGFGQLTITPRFNAYTEVKGLLPSLKDWDYDKDPFNPAKQIMGMLAKNKYNYARCAPITASRTDTWSCTLSAYNGGLGGYLSDRRLCSNTKGCDPDVWLGHVSVTSLKQKTALPGYGKPFFQINREYVQFVLHDMRAKYAHFY